jgi:hypothetical protein
MRHCARALAVVVVGTVVGLAAGPAVAKSTTPPVRSTADELKPGLMKASEVATISGLPKVRRYPLDREPLYEDPDPRGPCGAVTHPPPISEGATNVFVGSGVAVTNTVLRPGLEQARAFMAENLADARPGCAPYQSTTNEGRVQTVTSLVVALPALSDERLGTMATIQIASQTSYVATVMVRRGDLIAAGVIFAASPVSKTSLRDLAHQVDRGLDRLQ